MSVKISACTIAKNEEKNIARSIESYKNYVDEIIVVDTGSTDDTVKIAESLGAKVIHFKWINDFAAARNCAIEAATGDWILFLDADEWIKDDGATKLQTVISRAIEHDFDSVSIRMLNLEDNGSIFEITSALRIFKNKPNIRFVRKIHEHLINLDTEKTLLAMRVEDLVLNHSGYADSVNKLKVNRNKELLEKNYMANESQPIDYFYLARENAIDNPEYAKQFLDILENDEAKMKGLVGLDIANNILDLKIKLSRIRENKYSIKEKLDMLEYAIQKYPDNPVYYFYKYLVLVNSGKYENIELLYKAIELDEIYESKAGSNNNSFTRYKSETFYELAQEALRENNTLKALDCFVKPIQASLLKEEILMGLLYVIEAQELNEKIAFLNSIFDLNNEEQLKFLTQTLRTTKYNELFLYYFVKYYKTFGEVDISIFTSMLINKKYEDAAEKYLSLLLNQNAKEAEKMVIAAVIAGNLREFYEKNKLIFCSSARRILSAYFDDVAIEGITKKDEELMMRVMPEILYVASNEVLSKIKRIFDYNENVLKCIIRILYSNKDYKKMIEEINTFIENDLSDEFAGEVTAKLGEAFCILGDLSNAKLYLEQAIEIGYLDINLAKTYRILMSKVQISDTMKNKFEEYKYLIEKFIEAKNYIASEKIDDRDDNSFTADIKEFDEIVENQLNIANSVKEVLFDYANKLYNMKKWYLAEEYYKILLRCNYNTGKCYYNLGDLYNKLGVIELSYLCYDRAFRTAIDFPQTILPENHKNKYYLYNKKVEKIKKICPICGKEAGLINCYQHIEDNGLDSNTSLIVKYRKCDECSHIFAENYSENVVYDENMESKNEHYFNAVDIKEKISENTKIVFVGENDFMDKVFAEDFDTIFIRGSFEKETNFESLLAKIDRSRTLIIMVNNINSVMNENVDMPLWAKPYNINAYSKKSITKLLEDNGYNNIKIFDSKFLPGKMIVVAGTDKM